MFGLIINHYRETAPPQMPWPQHNLSNVYPPKFIYHDFDQLNVEKLPASGTTFMVHRSILSRVRNIFYGVIEECLMLYEIDPAPFLRDGCCGGGASFLL